MEAEKQRKFLADAAARGITIVEFMKEFEGNGELTRAVYSEMYPRPPKITDVPASACPVIAEVFAGMVQLANYDGSNLGDYVGGLEKEGRESAPSTTEEQTKRAMICARWFRVKVLQLVETDSVTVPAADIAAACKPLLEALTERADSRRVTVSVFESTLAIMNAYGTECARMGVGRPRSGLLIMMRSALMDLWRALFPWVPPGQVAHVASTHVHPDGDLDRVLTLAEAGAAAHTGSPLQFQSDDDELNDMLASAEHQLGLGALGDLGQADDMSPGGVLKK